MIKISIELPESEWLPADNLELCAATIEDILWYVHFPISSMIRDLQIAESTGDTLTAEMCKEAILMYDAKRDIVRQIEHNIKVEVV